MLTGFLALTTAALFAGAAIYVSVVEQPARLDLDSSAMLKQWQESYPRASIMQAGLAIISCLLGLLAFMFSYDWRWLLGAALIILPWPYTMFLIMPTNKILKTKVAETFDRAWRMLRMRRILVHAGDGFAVSPRNRGLISYYANSIAHVLGPFEHAVRERDILPAARLSGETILR